MESTTDRIWRAKVDIATVLIHEALEAVSAEHDPRTGYIGATSPVLAEALLKAGWRMPG